MKCLVDNRLCCRALHSALSVPTNKSLRVQSTTLMMYDLILFGEDCIVLMLLLRMAPVQG